MDDDTLIPPPELGFRLMMGPPETPLSYNQIRDALDAAHRWMQLYEIPPREVYEIMRRVTMGRR